MMDWYFDQTHAILGTLLFGPHQLELILSALLTYFNKTTHLNEGRWQSQGPDKLKKQLHISTTSITKPQTQ